MEAAEPLRRIKVAARPTMCDGNGSLSTDLSRKGGISIDAEAQSRGITQKTFQESVHTTFPAVPLIQSSAGLAL